MEKVPIEYKNDLQNSLDKAVKTKKGQENIAILTNDIKNNTDKKAVVEKIQDFIINNQNDINELDNAAFE